MFLQAQSPKLSQNLSAAAKAGKVEADASIFEVRVYHGAPLLAQDFYSGPAGREFSSTAGGEAPAQVGKRQKDDSDGGNATLLAT
jgi:hypothetical protein